MNGYIFTKTEIKERLTPQMVSGMDCLRLTLPKGNTELDYQEKTVSS